ncbi:hypothetical protein MPRS_55060 [Mycobacterium paraseoulense]|uniref:Uncharacterized protein n=1 Tax=Mycobacterium paraseoulense TaxID=590652 RepID=A0A1X0I8Q7_9MYCO|nr:hypothetical protein BST39_15900 [Mycobacterium paraseoulense]BBZ74413.1 hypothetical protein MPRS_55060 [Mycobacterium paraseoulense]
MLLPGDLSDPAHCRAVVDTAVQEFGGIDVLVNNAAYQMMHKSLDEISDEEWDYTFRVNVGAYFYLAKAAIANSSAELPASDDASYILGARVAVTRGAARCCDPCAASVAGGKFSTGPALPGRKARWLPVIRRPAAPRSGAPVLAQLVDDRAPGGDVLRGFGKPRLRV